jgi:(+)-trans-carveol dehydrogenase
MGTLDGKVAFITGAARGQGRSHALALAREGADIVALDIGRDAFESVPYPLGTEAELDETVAAVEALGRRALKGVADVRDLAQIQAVVDTALETFDGIDIVCANAGIGSFFVSWEITPQQWQDMIDVNLTGVFNTTRATLPSMIERGEGGSLVLTSSTAGLIGYAHTAHYTAAKHGVIGLMKVLAQELGPHRIRVNAVCPTTVNTPLVVNDATFQLFAPDVSNPTADDVREAFAGLNSLPDLPWIEPEDVSEAVVWLCSDAARYVTGLAMPIDAGNTVKKGYG